MKEQIQKRVFIKYRANVGWELSVFQEGPYDCILSFKTICKNALGFFASLGALSPLVFLKLLTETSNLI